MTTYEETIARLRAKFEVRKGMWATARLAQENASRLQVEQNVLRARAEIACCRQRIWNKIAAIGNPVQG